jgi:hypothetical protein
MLAQLSFQQATPPSTLGMSQMTVALLDGLRARRLLWNAHWGRAETLFQLGRFAASVPDWNRAVELDDGSQRYLLRIGRAMARVRAGQAEQATAEASEVAVAPGVVAGIVYDCACVFALAAAPGGKAADRYAVTAVAILRRSIAMGFTDVGHLLADADLTSLRERADYAALLWDLTETPAR